MRILSKTNRNLINAMGAFGRKQKEILRFGREGTGKQTFSFSWTSNTAASCNVLDSRYSPNQNVDPEFHIRDNIYPLTLEDESIKSASDTKIENYKDDYN